MRGILYVPLVYVAMPSFLQNSIFAVFDDEQTGTVSLTNLMAFAELPIWAPAMAGCEDASAEDIFNTVQEVIDEYDEDGDGELNEEEFCMALTGYFGEVVFLFFDTDRTGTVTFKNLKDAQSASPGLFLPDTSDEDIQSFIEIYDEDGDGGLDTEEFAAFMRGG